VVFHESGKSTPEFTLGQIVQLPAEMFCVCGYKTSSGNKLGEFYCGNIFRALDLRSRFRTNILLRGGV
jgi:hypothetical protein